MVTTTFSFAVKSLREVHRRVCSRLSYNARSSVEIGMLNTISVAHLVLVEHGVILSTNLNQGMLDRQLLGMKAAEREISAKEKEDLYSYACECRQPSIAHTVISRRHTICEICFQKSCALNVHILCKQYTKYRVGTLCRRQNILPISQLYKKLKTSTASRCVINLHCDSRNLETFYL